MSEANIRVRFRAQDEKFRQQLERTNERITKLGRSSQRTGRQVRRSFKKMDSAVSRFTQQVAGLLTAAAITGGAKRLAALVGEIVAKLDNIGKTADALGLTTSALQEFRYGFEAAGVGITETDKSIRRFHQAIGDADSGLKTYLRHFDTLGVSLRTANGDLKSTETLLSEVADALNRTGDEAVRQLAVRDLFGRSGNKLLVAFKGGAEGVENLRHEAVKAGAVIEEGLIRRAEEYQTKWDMAGRVVDANMGEMANSMIELRDAFIEAKVWSSELLADVLNIFTSVDNKPIFRLREELEELEITIENLQKKVDEKKPADDFLGLAQGNTEDQLTAALQRQKQVNDQLTKSLEERAEAERRAAVAQKEKIEQAAAARKLLEEQLMKEREAAALEAERVARVEGYRLRLMSAEEKYTDAMRQLQNDRIDGLINEMDYLKLAAEEQQKYLNETQKVAEEAATKKEELIETLKSRFESSFASLSDILERGSDAIKDTVKNLVKAVIDELWKLLVVQPIANALANAIGGFIFGGGGVSAVGPSASAATSVAPNHPGFSAGGSQTAAVASVSAPVPTVAPNHPGYSVNPYRGAPGGITVNQVNNFQPNVAATARAEIQSAMPTIVAQTEAAVRDSNSRRAV